MPSAEKLARVGGLAGSSALVLSTQAPTSGWPAIVVAGVPSWAAVPPFRPNATKPTTATTRTVKTESRRIRFPLSRRNVPPGQGNRGGLLDPDHHPIRTGDVRDRRLLEPRRRHPRPAIGPGVGAAARRFDQHEE